ncbi:MAG: heme peroxidase, partial [Gaiellaceae bacterium]
LFDFSGLSGDLGGGTRLPSIWVADWRRLYNFGPTGRNDLKVPAGELNKAMRIDTKLADPLRQLRIDTTSPRKNLAFRNLLRANMVKLATGQQMATFLRRKSVAAQTLTRAQIRDGENGAKLDALTTAQRNGLLTNTPLWFYILREAELNQGKLMRVGARIVAETFHRAMEGSTHSIVRDTAFRPSLGPNNTTFRMVDLLLFAFEGKKTLLNPNG